MKNLAHQTSLKSPYAKSIKVLQFSTIAGGQYLFETSVARFAGKRRPGRVIKDETFAQTHSAQPGRVLVW
jgi:hypothetical protein